MQRNGKRELNIFRIIPENVFTPEAVCLACGRLRDRPLTEMIIIEGM